ncbi:MAG TPA: START-like domain-containing protein [Dysgonamonadaceae bacterium]|jgi:uncharacterized protein YndB with AHSA1/START domain|nr:START-like domain-containing protein [Dysgonamonadaceae bacterium]
MSKEKFHIEFVMGNVSQNSLWRMVSHPEGLSEWFADEISVDEESNQYIFTWNKDSESANVIFSRPLSAIRFHWLDDEDENSYFEFALYKVELTGDMTLEITDFAEPDEKSDAIILWETQVEEMKRRLGI